MCTRTCKRVGLGLLNFTRMWLLLPTQNGDTRCSVEAAEY